MVDLMEELFDCTNEDKEESSLSEQQHLLQLITDGDFSVIYLLVEVHSSMYELHASNGELTWKGDLYYDDIRKFATTAKMDESNVLKDTEKAFTEGNNSILQFEFTTKLRHDNNLQLTWKKKLDAKDIKIQLGFVNLQSQLNSSVGLKMLNFAVTEIASLTSKIRQMELDTKRICNERQMAITRLKSAVNVKEELETDLFQKFVLLLNEKKSRIKDLSDHLHVSTKEGNLPQCADDAEVDSGLLLKDQNEISSSSPPVKRRKRESKQISSSKYNSLIYLLCWISILGGLFTYNCPFSLKLIIAGFATWLVYILNTVQGWI